MAHTPLKMTIPEAHREVAHAWSASYNPARITEALDSISHRSVEARIIHLIARLFFRGIYFPQMGWWAWTKVIARNRQTIFKLLGEAFGAWRRARMKKSEPSFKPMKLHCQIELWIKRPSERSGRLRRSPRRVTRNYRRTEAQKMNRRSIVSSLN
jgi:hypothetical protein